MSSRQVRTTVEEDEVAEEFAGLAKRFKPRFGQTEDITISKKLARVYQDERLMKKHQGKSAESVYRTKVHAGKKNLIKTLKFYFSKLDA